MKKILSIIILALSLAICAPAMSEESKCDEEKNHSHFLNNEEAGQLSTLTYVTPSGAYMKLFSGISVADYIRMNDDFIKLRDYTVIREVTLILNSPGGSAFDGLSISDLIERMQNDHKFIVSVQASGIVASAAVPVFAVCKNRSASPGTLFMVHEAALWKWPGRETSSDIIAQGALMKILQDKYLDYLVRNSNVGLDEWKKMEKATTWFTMEDARKLGLIERKTQVENVGR